MKIAFRTIPWIILAVPFIALAFLYNSIEREVLVMRSFFGGEAIYAPKSLFTVFRVPLIEVVCAAAIETIRPEAENFKYFSALNILLYTVTFKSLFQVFEFISLSVFSSQTWADVFFYATLAVVMGGICLVILKWREIFSGESRKNLRSTGWKKILIGVLLVAYFVLAFVPMFIYKSH